MTGNGEVAEPADVDLRQHLHVHTAPVALVVPAVAERFNDGAPAGQAFGAYEDGWIADQHQWPN
jgi:hypothetical protein